MSANSPQAIARRPPPRPAPRVAPRPTPRPAAAAALVPSGYVAAFDPKELQNFDVFMGTDFFDTLSRISAYGVTDAPPPSGRAAELRGYPRESLQIVSSIATHYLYSGGYRLSEVLFEGLTAVAPDEPYHWLALGLTYDRQNRLPDAERAYARAAKLAPNDPRPLVNLAELRVEAGALAEATELLERAVRLAERGEDAGLAGKARLMLQRFPRAAKAKEFAR